MTQRSTGNESVTATGDSGSAVPTTSKEGVKFIYDMGNFTEITMICEIQREQRVFYISHYSATEINPFHVCSVAENTTEINRTGKLIFFIHGGNIVERIINSINMCVFITI